MHTFKVHYGQDQQPNIKTAIMQSIGYGSVCWTNIDNAGVFVSEAAAQAGEEAVAEVRRILHSRLIALLDLDGVATEWNDAIEAAITMVEAS